MTTVEDIIAEFRANHGRVTSIAQLDGLPLVLVTHVGAKSGKRYTTPLGVLDDEAGLVIAATANASPTHPAWYGNLVANPWVTVNSATPRSRPTRASPMATNGAAYSQRWQNRSRCSTTTSNGQHERSRSSCSSAWSNPRHTGSEHWA